MILFLREKFERFGNKDIKVKIVSLEMTKFKNLAHRCTGQM